MQDYRQNGQMEHFIRRLPKAEMHLHLEGSFRWETVREFHPDGESLPPRPPWLEGDGGFPDFTDFVQAFREYVQPGTGTAESVERHTHEVIADLAQQNVKVADIIVGPGFHTRRGLEIEAVLEAIDRGRTAAELVCDIRTTFIYGLNRHRPLEEALDDFHRSMDAGGPKGSGLLVGLELQGDEREPIPQEFIDAFSFGRDHGMRLRAHAGEICGPSSVREVIDLLGVDQISHGVRAIEDPALVAEIAAKGICLHTCPTSNVLLRVCDSYATHPLRALFDAGCCVTINSDDPLLFGATITDEFRNALKHLGLSASELAQTIKNAFSNGLLREEERQKYLAEIDELVAGLEV